MSTVRSPGANQISSRRTASADGRPAGFVVRQQQPRGEVQRLLLETVALGLPAVRVGVVGGREEPRHEQRGELVRLEIAVFRDHRHGLVDPGPGLPGEYQIGRQVEGARRPRRRPDGERDADRAGPGRQRRSRGTQCLGQRVLVEGHPIVPGGDPDGHLRHPIERLVPGVAFEPPVGLDQPRCDALPFGGPPERLRLRRLRVAIHDQGVGAGVPRLARLAPVVAVRNAGPPGPQHGRRRRGVDAGPARPPPVLEGGTGRGIGRHGAVDREPGGLPHLLEKGVLDRLLAGWQDEFEIVAVGHVRQYPPGHGVLLHWVFAAAQRMKEGERWSAGSWRTQAPTSDSPTSRRSRVA